MSIFNEPIRGHYGTVTCHITAVANGGFELIPVNDFYRCGYTPEGDAIAYVDPSGGPFMSVGASLAEYNRQLPDMPIKSIVRSSKGFIFTL